MLYRFHQLRYLCVQWVYLHRNYNLLLLMLLVYSSFFLLSCTYIILIYKLLIIYSLFDFIFLLKNRQCNYCLDNFVCSFMVAPILKRASEKSLSSKVLINKEDFGIVGLILGWIEFDFLVVGWDFLLIFMGFYDMGCDNIFIWIKIEFCLILLEFLKISTR